MNTPMPEGYHFESAPEGYHFEVVPDPDWKVESRGFCRRCNSPAVATLFRVARYRTGLRIRVPWRYCREHMYGRWIDDGAVVHRILRPNA